MSASPLTKRDWVTLAQIALLLLQIGAMIHALAPIHVSVSCPPPAASCCCEDDDGGVDGGVDASRRD